MNDTHQWWKVGKREVASGVCLKGCSTWIENGVFYTAPKVDAEKYGPHDYYGYKIGIDDCICGCHMGSSSSSGPVDPFGACPAYPLEHVITPDKIKAWVAQVPTVQASEIPQVFGWEIWREFYCVVCIARVDRLSIMGKKERWNAIDVRFASRGPDLWFLRRKPCACCGLRIESIFEIRKNEHSDPRNAFIEGTFN